MRDVTLCLLLKENEVCLAMKKRGFGVGKWNGVGGKVKSGETPINACARGITEEIGVQVPEQDMQEKGEIDFYFEQRPEFNQRMHIFSALKWLGNPTESEEMAPKWFNFKEIPYGQMWIDDEYWLPKVLSGQHVRGIFWFNRDGTVILQKKLEFTTSPLKLELHA
jgi:8-oxo-dGTP diphosphatase